MTLELRRYASKQFHRPAETYALGGVKEITNNTIYGEGHFAITIYDTKVFITDAFEYVKDRDNGTLFVKDGEWVYEDQEQDGGSFNSGLGCFTTCMFC